MYILFLESPQENKTFWNHTVVITLLVKDDGPLWNQLQYLQKGSKPFLIHGWLYAKSHPYKYLHLKILLFP